MTGMHRAGLSSAAAGEFAKARSWRTGRALLVVALLGAALGSAMFVATVPLTMSQSLAALQERQRVEVSLMGVDVANIVCLVAAILFVSNENSSNLVEVTARLTPVRHRVVLAKLIVAGGLSCVISVLATLLAYGAGMVTLTAAGAPLPAFDGGTLQALLGTMLMIPVHTVLAVAMAYLTRSGLMAFLGVFAVMCLPTLSSILPSALDRAAQWLLLTPALHTISGIATPGGKEFTHPVAAAGVVLGWMVVPLLLAVSAFRSRDL